MSRRRQDEGVAAKTARKSAVPLAARLQLISGFRKCLAAALLIVTLLLGGFGGAAAAAGRVAWTWFAVSVATTAGAAVAANPRAIGAMRLAADGTMFQDYDNGKTLITHADGTWSLTATRVRGRGRG